MGILAIEVSKIRNVTVKSVRREGKLIVLIKSLTSCRVVFGLTSYPNPCRKCEDSKWEEDEPLQLDVFRTEHKKRQGKIELVRGNATL